jgi:hypothetical protein
VYLILGRTVGVTVTPKPVHMLLYSLGGLTAIYLITIGVRCLLKLFQTRAKANKEGRAV